MVGEQIYVNGNLKIIVKPRLELPCYYTETSINYLLPAADG